MTSSSAQIKAVAVYRKVSLEPSRFNADRIGGTCDQAFSRAADMIKGMTGKLAHKIGLGPEAAMDRILKKLKVKDREELLKEWYRMPTGSDIFFELEGDCHILLNYALPKEEIATQITTFVAITSLITQYPPLRSICLCYEKFNGVEDPEEVALNLWKRDLNHVPSEINWKGFYQIAAACLSDNVACILEATPVRKWGKASPTQLSIIDQLLAKISAEKLETLDYVAIRYLGGILQLNTFWKPKNYKEHKKIAIVILRKLLHCVKETGVEHRGEELFCDREGIDLLVNATLHGLQIWLELIPTTEATRHCWFNDLQELLALLSRPEGQFYLPLSWQTATSAFQEYSRDRWTCAIDLNGTDTNIRNNPRRKARNGPGKKSTAISKKRGGGRHKESERAVLETEYSIRDEAIDQMDLNGVQKLNSRKDENALEHVRNPLIKGVLMVIKSLLGDKPSEKYEEERRDVTPGFGHQRFAAW